MLGAARRRANPKANMKTDEYLTMLEFSRSSTAEQLAAARTWRTVWLVAACLGWLTVLVLVVMR